MLVHSDAVRPAAEETEDKTKELGKASTILFHEHGQLSKAGPPPVPSGERGEVDEEGGDEDTSSSSSSSDSSSDEGGIRLSHNEKVIKKLKGKYDKDALDAIVVKGGTMQAQLKRLLEEFGNTHEVMLQANQQMATGVHDRIKEWADAASALSDNYHSVGDGFQGAMSRMKNQSHETHSTLATIVQRHFKWHGKPVEEGPLGDQVDDAQSWEENAKSGEDHESGSGSEGEDDAGSGGGSDEDPVVGPNGGEVQRLPELPPRRAGPNGGEVQSYGS